MPVVNRGVVCESNFRLVSLFEPAGLRQCISRGDYIPDIDVNQVRHEDVASGRTVIKVLLDVEGSEAQIATRSALPGKSCGERETSSTFTKALEQLESLAQSYGVPLQLTSGQQHRSHGRIRDVSWHCSKRRQLAVLDGDCCLVYGMDSLSTNLERMTTANIAWEGLLAARNRPADGQVQGSPALRQLVARLSDTARTVLTRLEAERSNVAQYTNDLFSSGSEHNVVETSLLEEMEQALTDVAVLTGQSLREDALARLEGTLTSALSATLHAPRPLALTHEYQRSCDAVAWRPLVSDMLAVGCQGGVCLWTISHANANGSVGGAPIVATTHGSSAQQHGRASVIIPTAWARFLPTTTRITSISWNPLGHALAAASVDHSTVWLWEIATGKETLLRRALGGVSSLLWSPAGDKLLVTHLNAAFTLWESSSWQSDRWKYGNVRAAAWAPKGNVLLLSIQEKLGLMALHFTAPTPRLDAHLLPLELPKPVEEAGDEVVAIDWDSKGQRVAIALDTGILAILSTKWSPVLSLSLVGMIGGPRSSIVKDAHEELVSDRIVRVAFHGHCPSGALLAVAYTSGVVSTYPLYF